MPTLQHLLEATELDLSLVTGDPTTSFTAVRFPHRPEDRPWLAEGDLRLVEGAFNLPRPASDPVLSGPPAAVVYARLPRHPAAPDALVRRATELGVALLTLPPSVNLLRVEEHALRLLASDAPASAAAGASVQRYLLRALESAKPERDLLDRLYRIGGGSYVLLAPWGAVLARAGSRTWRGDPRQAAQLPEGPMRVAGAPARALRIESGGRLRAVLLALDDGAALPWLELTRTLLAVTALGRSAEASRGDVRRAALLAEWLAGPSAAALLAPRLRDAGLELENPYVVTVAESGPRLRRGRTSPQQHDRLNLLRQAGDELFRSLGVGALSETRADHCLWVFAGGAPESHATVLQDALVAALPGVQVRLGVSLPQGDLTSVADGYRQSLLALQSVATPSGVAHFDAFDPVYWVLRQQPLENLHTLRDKLVGPLKQADDSGKLWHTLKVYLHSAHDLKSLAEELHVHVNTLRYRLRRIETLLHQSLAQPQTLAKLYLAEQIDALLEQEGA